MEVTRGEAIWSFLWKLLERGSVQVIQLFITIILARILMPSEYGIIALIMVFVNICSVIVDGGFNTALIQKKNADNIDFSTIFFFGLLMSFIMYGVMFMASPSIADFYNQPELVPIIRVVSLVLILYSINAVQNAFVSRNLLFRKMFICSLGSVISSGMIGVIMAYHGYGVWALVAQLLIGQLMSTIIMWIVLGWRPQMVFATDRLKSLLNYGWKIFASGIIISVFVNIRKLIIGKFYAPSSLAYFERGDQFPNLIMTNIQSSVQAVLFPVFAKEQEDKARVKHILRRSTKMNCFVIYPLMMLLIVSAKPLILFILTEKWLPAVEFMQIFCIANFFRPITIPNFDAIMALGYSDITLKLEIIKKIVDVSFLVIAVFFGVYAIAWSIVLFNFACVFINLYPNKRLLDYGIPEQVKDALPTLLLTLIMGSVVYWIQFLEIHLFLVLILQFITGFLLYIILCYLTKEESFVYLLELLDSKLKYRKRRVLDNDIVSK